MRTNQDVVNMIDSFNDIRARVKLSSSVSLPSAVTYTFHNTYNSYNRILFVISLGLPVAHFPMMSR